MIERIEPSAGPPGTVVRISGRHLRGDTRVAIGASPLTLELSTPNLVTARVEPGVASGTLSLSTRDGRAIGPEFSVTSAAPPPNIERVSPLRAAVGSKVSIVGRNFGSRLSQNEVKFGDTPAIVSALGTAANGAASRLEVIVPEGRGERVISVNVLGAGEAHSAERFETLPGLSIAELVPPRAAAGARIEVSGTGFDRSVRAFLGTLPLRILDASATRLVVLIPKDAPSAPLRVESRSGAVATSAQTFEPIAPPVIESFEPHAGAVGTRIVVRGRGFGRDPSAIDARLGEFALSVRQVAPNELLVEVPPAAISGRPSIAIAPFAPI
ncbi:MAG TPA: IPT/TIG domain-containing protein, partial [Polyangiales bacterium]|nr:IPT/TIG domain-containing protein [Polyangiales bacterium]